MAVACASSSGEAPERLRLAIRVTLLAFWRVRRLAASLLVPYLPWVTFALALNLEIWRLNR